MQSSQLGPGRPDQITTNGRQSATLFITFVRQWSPQPLSGWEGVIAPKEARKITDTLRNLSKIPLAERVRSVERDLRGLSSATKKKF